MTLFSRRYFGKLTSKFVLEEAIFSNVWPFLPVLLRTNNNVFQQSEPINESPFYAEEEYEALFEDKRNTRSLNQSILMMNMRTPKVHLNIEFGVF